MDAASGVGRGLGVGVGRGVSDAVAVGVAVAVVVAVGVAVAVAVAVVVAVAVAVAVGVAEAVTVGVAVAVGVGLGQPPPPLVRCQTSLRNWKVAPFRPPTLQISPFPKNPAWLAWRLGIGRSGGDGFQVPPGQADTSSSLTWLVELKKLPSLGRSPPSE